MRKTSGFSLSFLHQARVHWMLLVVCFVLLFVGSGARRPANSSREKNILNSDESLERSPGTDDKLAKAFHCAAALSDFVKPFPCTHTPQRGFLESVSARTRVTTQDSQMVQLPLIAIHAFLQLDVVTIHVFLLDGSASRGYYTRVFSLPVQLLYIVSIRAFLPAAGHWQQVQHANSSGFCTCSYQAYPCIFICLYS